MTNDLLAILVDFDDTAAQQNVAETLLKAFGGSNWKGYREDFRNGSMNLRHYQEKAFNELSKLTKILIELIIARPIRVCSAFHIFYQKEL